MRCDRPLLAASPLWCALMTTFACLPAPLPVDDEVFVPVVQVPDCRGDNDGVIDASELPIAIGVTARVRVGTELPVDVDGELEDDTRVWDLSLPDPEAQPVGLLAAEDMASQWFADLFPAADVAAPLVPGNDQLGPLIADEASWRLLGAASKAPDPPEGPTRVVYDEPSVLYPFPLAVGAAASSSSRAQDALLLGVPTAFVDDVSVDVVRSGRVILPDLVLDNTLQVTVRLRRTLIAGDVQQVSHHFVHECLGEVARFVSPAVPLSDVLDDDFPEAREIWRLSL